MVIYQIPSQTNYLKIPNENFYKHDTNSNETFVFGGFRINHYYNDKYILKNQINS